MSHMNESCHAWMSHVTYEWVMSRMNESCHIWESRRTHAWVMSHRNEPYHKHSTHAHDNSISKQSPSECAESVQITRVYVDESCQTYKSDNATHIKQTCHIHEWVISHLTIWYQSSPQVSAPDRLKSQECESPHLLQILKSHIYSDCTRLVESWADYREFLNGWNHKSANPLICYKFSKVTFTVIVHG